MKRDTLPAVAALILAAQGSPVSADTLGAEPPATVVITHGFQLSGQIPQWPFALADAIARRAGTEGGPNGRILVYEGATGALDPCQHPQCTTSGTGVSVIVFDWAADSNEAGSGFSEAAAESLFAGLVAWSQESPPQVNLAALHLIGHSRGAIVNSEVAERLIAAGFPPPEQVTSLDPNDSGGALRIEDSADGGVSEGGLDDYDVNQEHPEYDCHAQNPAQGICAWSGTGHQDNYWQNDSGCFALLPDGLELFGSANFNQNELDDPFCHSETHRWYLFTADTATPTHPVTGNPPGPDWFGTDTACTASPRTVPLARTADGFNLSSIAGGESNRCPVGPQGPQIVLFDFGLREGLVNGDFERTPSSGAEAGWSFHGGDLQASIGVDTDRFLDLLGGDWAQHNRFFLPQDIEAIQICRKIAGASPNDTLSILLQISDGSEREMLSGEQQSLASISDWECFDAPVLEQERGKRALLHLSVTNLSSPNVQVDDLRLRFSIFADGFESGDLSAWTASVP